MIQRADIEAKAKELEDAIGETRESAKNKALLAAIGVGLIVVAAFWLGRRRGRKGSAVVEIYKI